MARVCPLCGEEYTQRELDGFPHICKGIPMPTIGQCEKCGTALNDLNVSDLYPKLCRGCARALPGNRDKAIQIIAERGRVLLVYMKPDDAWYIWIYVVSSDRMMLDLLRRSYYGRILPHSRGMYKWTCSRRTLLLDIARDLDRMEYNPQLSARVLEYCREPVWAARSRIVEDILKTYGHKCIRIIPARDSH